jgi:SAM-dependent methyltransferase
VSRGGSRPAIERAYGRGAVALAHRYSPADLSVFDEEETRRFLGKGIDDLRGRAALAWELLYRLEPYLYDRLIQAEPLHPAILAWLPSAPCRVVEVGAGTGRLTVPLAGRCDEVIAVEPARPLARVLKANLAAAGCRGQVAIVRGFFDQLPVPDGWADLVVACSAMARDPAHGGDAGLAEMERCCAPGGRVVIVWPVHRRWLASRGYAYRCFDGDMAMEFPSLDDAVDLAEIFYPEAVTEIRRRGRAQVPYELLGRSPPRDVAYKDIGLPRFDKDT